MTKDDLKKIEEAMSPTVKTRQIIDHEGHARIAAALVFITLIAAQTAVDIALPNSKYANISTGDIGGLLYLIALIWSFVKAVG